MNKNNYYYRKLGQSILFSDMDWKDIVDENNSYDNIFCEDFLTNFHELLTIYQQKECLEKEEQNKLFLLLSDIRHDYPYQTKTEKETIFNKINDMIRLGNRMRDDGAFAFYLEEYQKRYGIYANGKKKLEEMIVYYYIYHVDGDMHMIKQDLASDIYPLALLFYPIELLSDEHINHLLLSDLLLSSINAVSIEYPEIISDDTIRNRFLWLLKKNKELLKTQCVSSGDYINDMNFKIQNHLLLKKLRRIK